MIKRPTAPLLRQKGLRDTQSRRMVLAALERRNKAHSPYELQKQISAGGNTINTVTVYRVLDVLEKAGLAHRHPCNGLYSLCSMPEQKGHHGFLHCTSCGTIEEFSDHRLCRLEDSIAKSAKFRPSEHVSEIVGTCSACH